MNLNIVETDVLVLGGGGAAFRAALAARQKEKRTSMVFLGSGASPYIVAFNAPFGHADSRDNEEIYYHDMLQAGCFLNERRLVRVLADEIKSAVRELEELGIGFSRQGVFYAQRRLSGSSYPRSLYNLQGTGRMILRHLSETCRDRGVQLLNGLRIFSLLRDNKRVVGALAAKKAGEEVLAIHAGVVIIAMGGIGRIFEDSTYPADVSAQSYALALEAGARLIDMEFVQFEPTIVVHPKGCKGMEMPTAMLGDGAALRNIAGERFLLRSNPEFGEKGVEKAKMALCIQKEIDEGRGFPDGTVLFDTTVVRVDLLESYKSHCQRLREAGLEPTKEGARVRPAAHSHMGGVYIDQDGWCGVEGLYVCGEAAGGIHGASRLAGNSGSEILVFGARAGRAAADQVVSLSKGNWDSIHRAGLEKLQQAAGRKGCTDGEEIRKSLYKAMSKGAGLYRDNHSLEEALSELAQLQNEVKYHVNSESFEQALEVLEIGNMVLAGRIILAAAYARQESRGAHQRIDYPHPDDANWLKHISISQENDAAALKNEILPIH